MSLARTEPCVLLVEDDESLRTMLVVLLNRLGIEVDVADSFRSAREYLEQYAITGLITDYQLGDGKGTTLAAIALERNPYAKLALLSGSTPDVPDNLQGQITILEKPFSPEELRIFLEDFPRAERPA